MVKRKKTQPPQKKTQCNTVTVSSKREDQVKLRNQLKKSFILQCGK